MPSRYPNIHLCLEEYAIANASPRFGSIDNTDIKSTQQLVNGAVSIQLYYIHG